MNPTMFKAVVWKELRENLKWAVIVLLGISAVLTFAIPSLEELLRGQGVDFAQISKALDGTTAIGGLLAGLLLGAAQTLVESRGDKWGFLAHRPIGRTTLFWGKATAGILLYAMSTGLPVAVALSWIASPGYLPVPFDGRIALPALANLLCGLVFYFAAFLTGMRDARWYVSRALGIGAAICCLALQTVFAVTFWQAVAASALGLIIVGSAAWGTFVAGGRYGVQPRIGRVATGITIGLGIALVGFLVFALNFDRFEAERTPRGFRYTNFVVTADGVVVRITRVDGKIVEVSDPDGHPLERYRTVAGHQVPRDGVQSERLSRAPLVTPSFRSIFGLFSVVRPANLGKPIGWYYVHRLGLLAAYDSQSKKLLGWLGPDGFAPGEAKPRPFAGQLKSLRSYGDLRLLVLEDVIYRVDLDDRRVERVFQREPTESLLDATSASTVANLDEMAKFEVIWTTRRVIVQRPDGTKLLEAAQAANASRYPGLLVSRAMQAPEVPTFLWFQSNPTKESQMFEFNGAGAVVNSWTLPATGRAATKSTLRVAVHSAIFPLIGQAALAMADLKKRVAPDLFRWTVAVLSSLVSAAAVLLHGRRYAFPSDRLRAWTAIAFLLGPLGYLMMLALIEWPAREPCPACSRKRVVTRERCEHCGEAFSVPPQDGTEIFELYPAVGD